MNTARIHGLTAEEKVTFWRAEAFRDMECFSARIKSYSFAPHSHESFLIGVIENGVQSATVRGTHEHAGPGTIYLLNPGDIHDGAPAATNGYDYRMFYPDTDLLKDIYEEHNSRPLKGTPFFRDYMLHDHQSSFLLRRAHMLMEQGNERLLAEQAMYVAMCRILSHYCSDKLVEPLSASRQGVHRARDFLEANAARNIGLEQLAGIAGMSRAHFIRTFKKTFFITPHAFQTDLRVQKARRLLRAGISLTDVAFDCGFADQAHLTRQFKLRTGMTPSVFRAA